MKAGVGTPWVPVPDYQPYVATGDFNSDGVPDFAVAVIDASKRSDYFTLLIFNGSRNARTWTLAFMKSGLALKHQALFYGAPRPKPYRLIVGRFESEAAILVPSGRTYKFR